MPTRTMMMLPPYALRRARLTGLLSLLPLFFAILLAACSTGRDTSARETGEGHALTAAASDVDHAPPPPPVAMGTSVPKTVYAADVAGSSDSRGYSGAVDEVRASKSDGSAIVASKRAASGRTASASVTASGASHERSAKGSTVTLAASAPSTAAGSGIVVRGTRGPEGSLRVEGVETSDALVGSGAAEDGLADRRLTGKVDDSDLKDVEDEAAPAPPPTQRSGQLTSGEWNDLREWNFWSGLMNEEWGSMRGYWKLGSGARVTVQAHDGERPVIDAVAQLYGRDRRLLWTARTDNHGVAELYTGLAEADPSSSFEVVVTSGEETRTISDVKTAVGPGSPTVQARFRSPSREEGIVDVMFAIDATGSMGDELEYVKAELENVIDRVRDHAAQSYGVRVAANVYRDVTDDYLVRPYPFTQKMDDLVTFLRRQSAGGGGDTPEAVETALADAIDHHEWSPSARARLLFLVLDAPPHHTDDRLDSIAALVRRASERGIHVIPVASSGVDKETEFLLRMLALHTNGTYTFLTDHSGIGNSHIKPTIGDYKVEYLNDLLVRLIIQYSERYDSMGAVQPRVPAIR